MIGKSYVPPEWALGYMQSRWGYGSEADLYRVYDNYKKAGISNTFVEAEIDILREIYKAFYERILILRRC